MVWRRRHYRVRRAKQPGTFNFSVLDNGVISKEYWRLASDYEKDCFLLHVHHSASVGRVMGQHPEPNLCRCISEPCLFHGREVSEFVCAHRTFFVKDAVAAQ